VSDPRPEARERLPVTAALTAPVVVLAVVPVLQFADWPWLSLCLAGPVVTWGAAPFHRAAWRALRRGAATVETLVSVAVLAATAGSLATLSPGQAGGVAWRDRFWTLPHRDLGPVHVYLSVATVLTVVALAGRALAPPPPAGRDPGDGPATPDGWLGVYAVVVAGLAAGAFGFWLTAAGTGAASGAAAGVLVAACPVAVAAGRPAAHALAARRGSQLGVAVRDPGGLDQAPRVDTIVFGRVDLTSAGHRAAAAGVDVHVVGVDRAGMGRRAATAAPPAPRLEPTAAPAVAELRALGLRTVLLTPDDPQGALALAARVGIAEVFAEVVPRDRVSVVRRLQNEGRVVAFVGDAADPHDRMALVQAELGLGRAADPDPSHPTDRGGRGGRGGRNGHTDRDRGADVVLAEGDLWSATDALRLGRSARHTADGNRTLAFASSVATLPLAAAGLLNPLVALGAPALAGVCIVANSLRLRSFRSIRPPAHHRHRG
jgi:cation transport ATPase